MAKQKDLTEEVLGDLLALEGAVVAASNAEGSNHLGAALSQFENAYQTLHANLKTADSLKRP